MEHRCPYRLYNYLDVKQLQAFIVLKRWQIVMGDTLSNNIVNTAPFTATTHKWYLGQRRETIAATLTGAQQEGSLDINMPASTYLGPGADHGSSCQRKQYHGEICLP
jgi:hypothetical protein